MKTTFLLVFIFIISLHAGAKPPSDMQGQLDTWIAGQNGGVAAAWVDADGVTFFQSGSFDSEDPRPITPDTQFEVGSITKVFTALLLAESERLGKVSRNDPAAKYLLPPDDPAQVVLAKITLLSLTTHTSGLPRLPVNIGPDPDGNPNPYAAYNRTDLIAALRLHGPTAPAGKTVAYSNFGAAVLGEALAAAWGTSYADTLREHVLTPLGLKATSLGMAGLPPPANLAPGHTNGKRVPNWTAMAFAPAGAIRSSTRDMSIFLAACLGGQTSPLHAALATTILPQYAVPETGGQIGLGWFISGSAESPIYWHNGATAGSHAFMAFNPRSGTGLVLLANVQKEMESLGFAFLGAKPPQPQIATVSNASDYPGNYSLGPSFVIAITAKDGALFGQATAQPQFALRPTTADRFALIGVPAEISFERGTDGKVNALVLHQNGFDQRAPRGELPPPPKEITVSAETLRDYAGEYPLSPQFVLTVTETDGALFVQATGQGKNRVYASAKDEFFYKVVTASLTFERDSAGKVKGLILHQNGRDLPATKKQ